LGRFSHAGKFERLRFRRRRPAFRKRDARGGGAMHQPGLLSSGFAGNRRDCRAGAPMASGRSCLATAHQASLRQRPRRRAEGQPGAAPAYPARRLGRGTRGHAGLPMYSLCRQYRAWRQAEVRRAGNAAGREGGADCGGQTGAVSDHHYRRAIGGRGLRACGQRWAGGSC